MYGVSDLLRTCYEFLSAHIKKRSTSAYEEYELRIKEYELRMPTYLRRTCDVPFVSRYAVDTWVDTRMCDSPITEYLICKMKLKESGNSSSTCHCHSCFVTCLSLTCSLLGILSQTFLRLGIWLWHTMCQNGKKTVIDNIFCVKITSLEDGQC